MSMLLNGLSPEEARRLIESSPQIHMHAFQIALGVLTGVALICFIARMAIRITYQKRLKLDDAFLILAAACLCAATGILYNVCWFLYLHSAALLVPQLTPFLLTNFYELLELQKRIFPFLALIWTTTYAVKGCFLAFMRPLVWHISRGMNWYYWFICGFTAVSWAFAVSDPFIICPYFGFEAIKCFTSTVDSKLTVGLTALVTVLDILTDLMVVSLPIIVLRGSQLSRSTKFGLAIFLCLSIFMVVCAITRMAGFHYKGVEDDTYEFFWQHAEGAVAVMMASITAFRTLFVKPTPKPNAQPVTTPRSPVESLVHRILNRFQYLARARPENGDAEKQHSSSTFNSSSGMKGLPKIPSPIFTGLRTFIRRNNRSQTENTTVHTFATQDSTLYSVFDANEADYHAVLESQKRAAAASSSHIYNSNSSGNNSSHGGHAPNSSHGQSPRGFV
ncbi:hypothetical protein B0H63DRAFT_527027 [Podospora didyma]|uniref:Rhodopsin domain-containing protein n=1 Tax=Podospora didyma TaxID=330526 RepID=A0AAE0K936_9PEZI|nr:hypothetical protein B0H63DRAFT_527027 [Podospora didyma]